MKNVFSGPRLQCEQKISGSRCAAAAAMILTIGALAAAEVEYTVIHLGMPDGALKAIPLALNDNGEIVGEAFYPSANPPVLRAWRWSAAEGVQLLPQPAGFDNYRATAINNAGQIAGDGDTYDGEAWRFEDGAYLMLGTLPGQTYSTAEGMNAAGDIAGTALDAQINSPQNVFLYTDKDGLMQIDQNDDAPMHVARGINDTQQVIGYTNQNIAYRWSANEGMELLAAPEGFAISFPYGLNNDGAVVGETKSANGNARAAFLYTDVDGVGMEVIVDIAGGDDFDRANAINEAYVVVGASHLPGQESGWVWSADQGVRLLDELVDPDANVNILDAIDINETGQIIALASDTKVGGPRAILLTPIQGPSTPGDVDGDGDVDFDDFTQLLASWGPCPGNCPADIDGDGDVDFDDFTTLLANWTPPL